MQTENIKEMPICETKEESFKAVLSGVSLTFVEKAREDQRAKGSAGREEEDRKIFIISRLKNAKESRSKPS